MNETIQKNSNNKTSKIKTILKLIVIVICIIACFIAYQTISTSKVTVSTIAEATDSLTYQEPIVDLQAEKEEFLKTAITKYVTANSGLNVRGKNWKVIATLPKHSEVIVIKEKFTDDQLYDLVLYNNNYAYMYSKYLSTQKQTQTQKTKTETTSYSNSAPTVSGNYLGKFSTTAYCNCSRCCGKWAGGPTASGVMPKAGRTIAVDPKIIPLGTKVIINGNTYIAEDTGSAIKGKKIDIYHDSHSSALAWGRRTVDVYLAQ